jgi:thiol-disulfide isomerase/thioredoxin
MANQIGNQATQLNLTDTTGQNIYLNNINSKFTFVAFWDPTCGHCKEEIPRLDSLYKAKWKQLGVKVYSVNVNEAKIDDWKKFMAEKKLSADWIQAYETKAARDAEQRANQPNFRQLYDMYKTPTFYLLDENKHIVAKQLGLDQFTELILAKLKK